MVLVPSRESWGQTFSVYLDRRILLVGMLGFSSGLPLLLVLSTLALWLSMEGVPKSVIGLFLLAGQPYIFKFAWAPLIDKLRLPPFTNLFGRRRGWALAIQFALIAAILVMGASDPKSAPLALFGLAFLVSFLSASQDIVLDALRIEMLEERQYGAGAAVYVTGYRLGMLMGGAGALFVAGFYDWFWAYAASASTLLIGIIAILLVKEPPGYEYPIANRQLSIIRRLYDWGRIAIIDPFGEFMRRPAWWVILLFAVFYKFGDSLAGAMANPFYYELGFTLPEIATVSKFFGLLMTLIGALFAGLTVARWGILKALMFCGVLQMLSNLMFAAQALMGDSLSFLALTIAVENLSGGMGTTAFVAYLSALCNIKHTATQYALLSALASVARTYLSAPSGFMAESFGWFNFFAATTLAALPGLLILWWLMRRSLSPDQGRGDKQSEAPG